MPYHLLYQHTYHHGLENIFKSLVNSSFFLTLTKSEMKNNSVHKRYKIPHSIFMLINYCFTCSHLIFYIPVLRGLMYIFLISFIFYNYDSVIHKKISKTTFLGKIHNIPLFHQYLLADTLVYFPTIR